ncbi:hypothetical protein ACVWXN_009050 [Bradyrhizobium sp. i1.4.4]
MPVAEETRRPVKGGHKNKQGTEATMNVAVRSHATTKQASEHFDVLIVGAGISGIGSAYHIEKQLPGTSYVILETQATFGGTWSTHRYPGIRSDSDLHTFGYSFKPWVGPPIATAEEILTYMNEVIEDNDIAPHIRYKHQINSASWSSEQNLWTIEATTTDTGEAKTFTANFLWMCQGYYRHSEGYTPEWKGMDRFKGRIVHPQSWPDDIDLANKKVVVIGSRARPRRRWCRTSPTPARMSPCCSARRPISGSAATPSRSPRSCAGFRSTRNGSTRSSAAKYCSSRMLSQSSALPSRSR